MLKDFADFDMTAVFLSPLLFATQNSDIPIQVCMQEQWIRTLLTEVELNIRLSLCMQ